MWNNTAHMWAVKVRNSNNAKMVCDNRKTAYSVMLCGAMAGRWIGP